MYGQVSTGQEQEFDYGIKNNSTQTVTTPTYLGTVGADGTYGKILLADLQGKKAFLSTGLIKNGLISANVDPTKFNITAGIGIISNFDDPENPTSTIINFPAFTGITPTYLLTGTITYVAINNAAAIVMQATPFTPEQRRSLIVLGAVVHSNLTTINVINNISAPSNASTNQLHDFIEAVGALNLTGNKYTANGANLQLDKSAGLIFKLGSNFANDWKNPHELAQISGTSLTFRYRTQNGTEGSDRINLDPALYDLNNVLTAVPNNKFTIQTVTMFQSGVTRIQYGQTVYDDLATAKNAVFTRNFVLEPNSKENGIIRAYIIMKNTTTSLQNVADADILEAQKFGGVASGGVALTLANIVTALGYTPENVANKDNGTLTSSATTYPTSGAVKATTDYNTINSSYNLNQTQQNKYRLYEAQKLMLNPPVLATPVQDGTTTIPSAVLVNARVVGVPTALNPQFSYYDGDIRRADYVVSTNTYSGVFPDFEYVKNVAVTTTNSFGNLTVEFMFDGTAIELIEKGQGGRLKISIDEGKGYQTIGNLTIAGGASNGSKYLRKITFPGRALRKIKVQYEGVYFGGAYIGPNDVLSAVVRRVGKKAIFLGNSFTEGTGTNTVFNNYASICSQLLGWECWNSGSGGTGYIATGPAGRVKFQDRVTHDVISYNPDIVVIEGGTNDTAQDQVTLSTAVNLLISTVKTALPSSKIYVLSNFAVQGITTNIINTRNTIKTASASNGVYFIDSVSGATYDITGALVTQETGSWITGIGSVTNIQTTGNASIYTATDAGHPSIEGHRYIGERLAGEIVKLNGIDAFNTVGSSTMEFPSILDSSLLHTTGNETKTGVLTLAPTVSATSLLAKGAIVSPSLTATANNDALVGLDISPTFTNGAFTGTSNNILRANWNTSFFAINDLSPSNTALYAVAPASQTISSYFIRSDASTSGNTAINTPSVSGFIDIRQGNTAKLRIMPTTGNVIIQNGGTFTDSGFRLDVNGTSRFQSTITIPTAPTTSAGTYDFLTRNTSTGVVEKITSSSAVILTTTNQTKTGQLIVTPATTSLIALQGNSTSNVGVYGTSVSDTGVYGTGIVGVQGVSAGNIGVYGTSTSGFGVRGDSGSNYGVYGNSTSGRGIIGVSGSAEGVFAQSNTSTALVAQTATGTKIASFLLGAVEKASVLAGGEVTGLSFKPFVYTVATLPSPPITGIGTYATVSDALAPSYMVTVVGGGSVVTPVFYNGTNWVPVMADSRPYKVYTALLTQTGSGAPTVTVLENTIGDIVWTRLSAGLYNGTLTGAFLASKTAVYLTNGGNIATPAIFNIYADTVNTISLKSIASLSGMVADSLVNTATLEIRVYN